MNDLIRENQRLRLRLDDLLDKANDNQRIHDRFQNFELDILSCRNLHTLLVKLLFDAREHFDLYNTRLILFDPEGHVQELLDYIELQEFKGLLEFVSEPYEIAGIYGEQIKPLLRPVQALDSLRWFASSSPVQSCALLPLQRENVLIGSFHLGSQLPQRFSADKAVYFMERLALIVAVCLENCINHERLRRISLIDMLTRVKNRRSFAGDLKKELSRAERTFKPLSCLFIDVDHFKKVNDTHGHQAGDTALKLIARMIAKQLRQTDHLARYGGEEFAALLPDCDREKAIDIAERVRLAAEKSTIHAQGGDAFKVTLSVGVSTWQPSSEIHKDCHDWIGEQLVSHADSAVYQAKNSGRNRVCYRGFDARQRSVVS